MGLKQQLARKNQQTPSEPKSPPQNGESTAEAWPDLIPFDAAELLELDTELLPGSIRAMVEQVGTSTEALRKWHWLWRLGAIAAATVEEVERAD
ncbi:MAG: hypothetical protein R3C49_19750 [Planctomycetaceae bacterium]